MGNHSVLELWEEYRTVNPNAPDHYDAWPFGDSKEMADELARLVIEGTKTATASNYAIYEIEKEPLPYPGLHNIILDGSGEAVAIVETTHVNIIPFNEVSEEHAYLEGEGDRSLSYWREVHEAFFTREFDSINQDFHYQMPVVCERFKVVYKRD